MPAKQNEHMVKADHPKTLLHGSLVSPSLGAAIIEWKICERSSSLSIGAGIPALWPADHKAEHGKLVHTFGRGISINPL